METYHGYVRTPADAIKLFEACRLGLLPRVQRRLSEKERQSIRSGSVFVWDEREAGMRRWTDGKSWSASRVSGSFLTYREMEGKRGSGFGNGRRGATKTPDSGRGSDEDQETGEPEGYRYKADGLMKQSFSITTSAGQHLHLISYYSRPQPGSPDLLQPSTDSQLRNITPVKGMYPESSLHDSNPTPALTRAPMVSQHSPYMVPQHAPQGLPPQPYASQYAQHSQGYAWPPSPVATPPYSHHYTATPYSQHPQQTPAGAQALPPPHSLTGHPHAAAHGHYSQHPPQSERTALPPLNSHQKPLAPSPYQSQQQSPRISHAQHSHRLDGSPRLAHLQAQAAQAVGIDPAGSHSSLRNSNTLPAVKHDGTYPPTYTPPNRALSISPPRSSHSDSHGNNGVSVSHSNKASLSALLHPAPAGIDTAGALPHAVTGAGSPNGSPRTIPAPSERPGGMSHDAKALQMLDRKFCI
ncbi:hypothetical protein VD0004_g6404 [Verticillium dahliae]|nr:hypothetical protein VdG1_01069 [Verticillium dahliae VDG1]PNH40605.1 hypothetical protein VD0004_g6404 [Verticillium dahliae]PNH71733.1 hypothetical protein VD0001_g5807 [Verticillium dahliae]RBQ90897.1 hypothetical protein VDGD_09943 [Verticillium dahliae]